MSLLHSIRKNLRNVNNPFGEMLIFKLITKASQISNNEYRTPNVEPKTTANIR